MNPEQSSPHKKTGIIIAVVVIFIVGVVIFALEHSSSMSAVTTDLPSPSDSTVPTVSVVADVPKSVSVYEDGTYTATGSYISPGGPDTVKVTLTIANDIVTNAQVVSGANDPESAHYQGKFISGYKSYVVGKNINTIHLTEVSGSSLTPMGFNDALTQIKAHAMP